MPDTDTMLDLKPYPVTKESGVSWLGLVPNHWNVRRLKNVFRRIVGGSTPTSTEPEYWDGDIVWITPFDVSRTSLLTTSVKKITRAGLASCSTDLVPAGSVIVTSRAPVGNVALASVELCTNQGCKALVPNSDLVVPLFSAAALLTAKSELQSLATGTTFSEISTAKIGTIRLPLPSVEEQFNIVRFLGDADRRINRLIKTKRRLMELLTEQKQSIVHHLVTRGLDPNVRCKPSAVEWLGDIPEHWDVRRNGQLFVQRNETGFADLPILEVSLRTGVRVREFEATDRKQIMSDRGKYKRAVQGDIAYNMMRMWQGAVGVAPVDGLVSPAYVVARPLSGTDSRLYSHLFRTHAYMMEADKYSRGIVKDRNRLYWEDFKQMPSPCPPAWEQVQIADAIEERTERINVAIDRARREIELIREYRFRLISDVVTGKLDVRDVASRLPDEVSIPEAFVEADDMIEVDDYATDENEIDKNQP